MARKTKLNYKKAGVDIHLGDALASSIGKMAQKTRRPEVLSSIGGFGALSRLPKNIKNPLLVTSTDGVGTKILLAAKLKKYDSVGIDLVAMCVNDILTLGAQPSVFLDYYAVSKLNYPVGKAVIQGIVKGCAQAQCALVGGETAEMPGVYHGNDFDLAGFCVGVVNEKKMITGKNIRAGDQIVGMPSSGVHSNGFSLVRKILKQKKISLSKKIGPKTLGQVLLTPTRIYVKDILKLLKMVSVQGMAHITGSGIEGNLSRVLPSYTSAVLNEKSWHKPAIFAHLQAWGNVDQKSMYETFNMGLGFCVVVRKKDLKRTLSILKGSSHVGEVVKSNTQEPQVFICS